MWSVTEAATTGSTLTITRGSTNDAVTNATATYAPGEIAMKSIGVP